MANWYPKLVSTGVQTPKTRIVERELNFFALDEGKPVEGLDELANELNDFAEELGGYPIFLRSGQMSDKHEWNLTCYIAKQEDLKPHICNIAYKCLMADVPITSWAVREFLHLESNFKAFEGLPINKERRYFINNGKVECHHPYWPHMSIKNPSNENWEILLSDLNFESEKEVEYLTKLSEQVSEAFDGFWSLDWAMTKDGVWYAIDMAQGAHSFHWEECPVNAEAIKQEMLL